jgi:hypothetical protein
LLQQCDLAIDAQDLGHLGGEVRVAALEIITHLVRFDVLPAEDLAQRAPRQLGQTGAPRLRAMLANVLGKQARRPQFVGIAEVLGFAASQIHNEGPRLVGDRRLASRPRAVVERRHDAEPLGAAQTAFDRLMRHPNRGTRRRRGRAREPR